MWSVSVNSKDEGIVLPYPVQTAAFEGEAFAAPVDGVAGEGPDPEDEACGIADGEQPEVGEYLAVGEDACAYLHGGT